MSNYNCANLILRDEEIYHDPKLYNVSSLENKENPTNIPGNWSLLLYDQVVDLFELQVLISYSIFNPTDCVFNENGVPQYFIGEFNE